MTHDVLDSTGQVSATATVDDATGMVTFVSPGAQPQRFATVAEFLTVLHAAGGSCPDLEESP